MKLYDTLGSYIFSYLLSEDNSVNDETEEKTVELLKQCNEFAIANNMRKLCEIYDVFGLEQDAMIIYYIIVQHWIEKIQQA
ncbi:hypothetical protein HF863_00155 [Lactobacillus agilis]|uniref:Uncharacterized protein n=1 Tax=Ligilactobacillus agilis TaxID=1601 RepID=A0A848C200_9LACO|nr:hypothetical protein [Ligilactobacillus agilis]NME41198.1 hypothetical protein [Ligilactobacillus agilis]